jgi:glycosyltransferase involved in cell wall biosynthesis
VSERVRITFFGTYDERLHPRVRVLKEGLVAAGHEVREVNVPLRFGTAARVRLASQPWRAPALALRVLAAWTRLLVRSRRVRRPEVVVVGYLGQFDVHLARLRWRRAHLVLDHMVSLADTVRDRGIDGSALVLRLLTWTDRAATRQADTVMVDTEAQVTGIAEAHRSKVLIVPVGAPEAWFTARAVPDADADAADGVKPLRVVFYGLYTPLQGTPTIGEAIGLLADRDIEWTMIGAGQDLAATRDAAAGAAGRVRWVDWVDADDLPAIVNGHDVCLGIFGTGPKALRVVPNKVYQGAAAGCAIVTSGSEPQRASLGEAAVYVAPGRADELARALARLDDDRTELSHLRRAARDAAERRYTAGRVTQGLSAALVAAHHERMSSSHRRFPPLPPNAALRWDLVHRHLDRVRPASVLELGIGQGAVATRLAARADYVGVEPDATSRATAQSRLGDTGRVVADLAEVDAGRPFDLVCAFEVLEHIADDKGVLADWVERLRPGGHVLVSVPAEPDRYGPFDKLVGHFRRYAVDDLAGLFESAGLEVVSIDHYGFPLGNVLEAGRNLIGKRRLAKSTTTKDLAERTASSGRNLQPPQWSGAAIWWGSAPFRGLQRRFPGRGTGLLGVARRPDPASR